MARPATKTREKKEIDASQIKRLDALMKVIDECECGLAILQESIKKDCTLSFKVTTGIQTVEDDPSSPAWGRKEYVNRSHCQRVKASALENLLLSVRDDAIKEIEAHGFKYVD